MVCHVSSFFAQLRRRPHANKTIQLIPAARPSRMTKNLRAPSSDDCVEALYFEAMKRVWGIYRLIDPFSFTGCTQGMDII